MRIQTINPQLEVGRGSVITRLFLQWLQNLVASVPERLVPTGVQDAAYSANAWDLVECDPTLAGFTVTLPEKPPSGTEVMVKNASASANAITIAPRGTDTIDGAAGATIAAARGVTWFIYSHETADWRVA